MAGLSTARGGHLIRTGRRLLNALIGLLVRHGKYIEVGRNTYVRWWGLKGQAGGSANFGRDSIIHCRIDFDDRDGHVIVGDRCYIGASHLVCHTGISIGDDVIISWGVTIVDHDSHALNWSMRKHDVSAWSRGEKDWASVSISPVIIGSKVWIGFGASILKGVTIGEGSVVGAQSVVTRNVPPFSVVAGNPARVIRPIEAEADKVQE